MSSKGQIHWCEGLFLRPHHLQIMQKNLYDQIAAEHRLAWPYPYGLVESRLSVDELENMRVFFDRLRVVMPSGLEVNVPHNAELPSLDIKKLFMSGGGSLTVSLGVPLWYESRANAAELIGGSAQPSKSLYRVEEIQRTDENSGNNAQPILIRRINAKLLLDGDDTADYEVLPLFKIVRAAGEEIGLPRPDSTYIPPCLVLSGSPILYELVRDLTNQVMASRNELVSQINRGGFAVDMMRGIQFEQMLRLQILNRFSARLSTLIKVPGSLSPFQAFLELRQLLAELSSLQPARDQFHIRDYDHDDPALGFRELSEKIRPLLKGAVKARFEKVPFIRDDSKNLMLATLKEEHFTLPNDYYLGITTRQDHAQLAQLVLDSDKFKCMPLTQAHLRIFGVKLQYEQFPPTELPAQGGVRYFRLLRGESQQRWDQIMKDKAIALVWPDWKISDYQIALYMTVPDVEVK